MVKHDQGKQCKRASDLQTKMGAKHVNKMLLMLLQFLRDHENERKWQKLYKLNSIQLII